MDWENHLEKNTIQKIEKTEKIKMKLPHVNKKTTSAQARKRIFVRTPFSYYTLNKKVMPRTNYEWIGKLFSKKNQIKKIEKPVNIKVKLPHVNKKIFSEKKIFVQTPFSYCTLKLERKNFTPQNHLFFRSTSCFHVTKITTRIRLQKL